MTSGRETAASVPRHLRYTWDHEWLIVDEGNATVGITAFAARTLGDVVHLRLPEVGTAPASGRVLEVNAPLAADPGVVNSAPYTGGWLFRLRVENIAGALSADAYAAHTAPTPEETVDDPVQPTPA